MPLEPLKTLLKRFTQLQNAKRAHPASLFPSSEVRSMLQDIMCVTNLSTKRNASSLHELCVGVAFPRSTQPFEIQNSVARFPGIARSRNRKTGKCISFVSLMTCLRRSDCNHWREFPGVDPLTFVPRAGIIMSRLSTWGAQLFRRLGNSLVIHVSQELMMEEVVRIRSLQRIYHSVATVNNFRKRYIRCNQVLRLFSCREQDELAVIVAIFSNGVPT
ncbi:hypothetical protein GQR58_004538 [Nymphon striatum]|nr:hypothetical protein GQR58_004538 [Nymphon striatum]